jgi:transcriptional regulator with XRE-family HTH domain
MDAQQLVSSLRKMGLSQKDIAEKCGMSQGGISHIETGRRKNVLATTKEQLDKLYLEQSAKSDAPNPEQAAA